MSANKRLTTNGLSTPHLIQILMSLGMIGIGAYMTSHFYDTYFPTGISNGDSLCDINAFWGCGKATQSVFGMLFGIPTAFFGIVMGVIGLIGSIFPSERMESTNKALLSLNAAGCLFLLSYSLFVLKGLCPFCTLYYIVSFISTFLFFKFSDAKPLPDVKIAGFYAVIVLVPSIFMHNYFNDKMQKQTTLSASYVEQYKKLQFLGDPAIESPYKIHMANSKFSDAPVRISIYSDFECPFCKMVSEQLPDLIKGYEDKINIQYFFYPLDSACNVNVKRAMHQYACRAASLAACDVNKFHEVHDYIFARQEELNSQTLEQWQKKFGLSGCFENQKVLDQIALLISSAEQFNLKSTPTIIVNGKKIEGSVPTIHFRAIIQSILNETK